MPFIIFFLFLAQILGATTIGDGNAFKEGDYLKWTGAFTSAPQSQWGASQSNSGTETTTSVGTGSSTMSGQWMPTNSANPWLSPSGSQGSGTGDSQTTGAGGNSQGEYYILEDYVSNPTGHANLLLQRNRLVKQDPPTTDSNADFNKEWSWYQNQYGKPIVVPPPPPPPTPEQCEPSDGGGHHHPPPHHSDVPEPGTLLTLVVGIVAITILRK